MDNSETTNNSVGTAVGEAAVTLCIVGVVHTVALSKLSCCCCWWCFFLFFFGFSGFDCITAVSYFRSNFCTDQRKETRLAPIFGVRKAAPSAQQRHVQNRDLVVWWVVDGPPCAAIDDMGLKLTMSQEYAGSSPSSGTLYKGRLGNLRQGGGGGRRSHHERVP